MLYPLSYEQVWWAHLGSNQGPMDYESTALTNWAIGPKTGGDKQDRTADLLHAMQALSQLSYTPMVGGVGFEPTHPGETDLQSAAVRRLCSPPI